MARWLVWCLLAFALPAAAGANPSRAPAWAAVLDRHADIPVDRVVGEREDALLVLTGTLRRLHGRPVSGLGLRWLHADGRRSDVEGAPELLGADLSPQGRLAVVTLDGGLRVGEPGALEPVDLGDREIAQVRWDPEGRQLAVTAWPEGVRSGDAARARTLDDYREAVDSDILLVSPDRGTVRQLTTGSKQDYNPVWSPDGRHLLFISLRTGYASFFVADVSSGRQTQLTNHGAERGAAAVPVALSGRCVWDGTSGRVVYETREDSGEPQVWVLDPDGDSSLVGAYRDLRAAGDGSALARGPQGWVQVDLLATEPTTEVLP